MKQEKKEVSKGLLFILFIIALILDVIEFVETILDLGIIGFILFFITTPLNLLFYALIFFSGLWKTYGSTKKVAVRIIAYLVSLIGENIPVIEILPLNTLNVIIIILQERPEMFGKFGELLSPAMEAGSSSTSYLPTPTNVRASIKPTLPTKSELSNLNTMETPQNIKLIRKATQSSAKPSSKITKEGVSEKTPKMLRKAKAIPVITSIVIIVTFLMLSFPVTTKAQSYDYQNYYDIMEPFFKLLQPFQMNTGPDSYSPLQPTLPKQELTPPKQEEKNIIYLSVRKVPGGLMIGVEPLISENGKKLSAEDFRYQFQITEISLQWKESWNNVFVFRTFDLPNSLTIKVTLISLKSDTVYKSQKSFIIPPPKLVVVSVDPVTYLISMFHRNSRFVTVLPFYFTSETLRYRWLINNNVISESPMIELSDQKNIMVEVTNPYHLKEKAIKFISLP